MNRAICFVFQRIKPGFLFATALLAFSFAALGAEQGAGYDDTVGKARLLIDQKKPKEAVALAEQAIQMDENRWEAYYTAASAYSAEQFYDDAIGMLQIALAHAPPDKKQAVRTALADARRSSSNNSKPTGDSEAAPTETRPGPAAGEAETILWKSIESSKNVDDYRGYLKTFPKGIFAGIASTRLETLEWKAIEESSDAQDFQRYVTTFPAGTYSDVAKARIAELKKLQESEEAKRKAANGTTFEWRHDHGHYTGPVGKLRLEPNRITWKEDPVQKDADSGHDFSATCSQLKWEHASTSYGGQALDLFVKGQRFRFWANGHETAFLKLLEQVCKY